MIIDDPLGYILMKLKYDHWLPLSWNCLLAVFELSWLSNKFLFDISSILPFFSIDFFLIFCKKNVVSFLNTVSNAVFCGFWLKEDHEEVKVSWEETP